MNQTPTAMVTGLVILVTGIISYQAFSNRGLHEKLVFCTRSIFVRKEYHRLFSMGLIHSGWMHLIFNMVALYLFGRTIELIVGAFSLAVIYLCSILGGSLLTLYLYRHQDYRAVGASGGVCGIVYASIFLWPHSKIMLLILPIPMPAWVFGIGFMIYTIYGVKTRRGTICHEGHMGGAVVGGLVTTILYPQIIGNHPWIYFSIMGLSIGFLALLIKKPHMQLGMRGSWLSKNKAPTPMEQRYANTRGSKRKELDRILDKISQSGMGSLTAEERSILDSYSK